jgi:GT2 family glycosyltransferase
VLLLNSDTIVGEDTFRVMVDFLDAHPQVGAAGCKVVLPDGSLDKACRRSFPTPLNSLYQALKLDRLFPNSPRFASYNLTYLDEDESYPVDCLVGAFMMVRRKAIEQVGMLDEMFFMYGEDIDWCYRIKRAGWEIWYVPATTIIHYKGASSKKKKVRMIWEFHRAMILYYKKHHAKDSFFLLNWLVYLGVFGRCALVLFGNLFKKRGVQDDPLLPGVHQSHTRSA